MKKYPEIELYEVNNNVKCLKCGHKGAIQFYGNYYPAGLGERVDEYKVISLEKYRDNPHMSHAVGFGGTVPYQCTNCDSYGLIDFGRLEGYEMAFETVKEN